MMKNLYLTAIVLILFACKKTENSVNKEEPIRFTTNLDTSTSSVTDTMLLVVTVSSKIPTAGVLYSISATWIDISRQIFRLDTTSTSSNVRRQRKWTI
jgi:hypothetical protein